MPVVGTAAATNSVFPSPLEGEGARRAGEGITNAQLQKRGQYRTKATPRLRGFAKTMRSEPTEAEARLWRLVRNRRFSDFKFRRQVPVGSYIVDLMCPAAMLIIELDGSQHADSPRDLVRDRWLAARGYRVLRLWNNDVIARPDQVLDAIWHSLTEPTP